MVAILTCDHCTHPGGSVPETRSRGVMVEQLTRANILAAEVAMLGTLGISLSPNVPRGPKALVDAHRLLAIFEALYAYQDIAPTPEHLAPGPYEGPKL